MTNVLMVGPAGVNQFTGKTGAIYLADSNGVFSLSAYDAIEALRGGFTYLAVATRKVSISSALPADLVSIVAAVTPANGAQTLAAQPPHARKLQYRIVIGTTTTTAITAGTATVVGTDQDGNAITEVVSLIQNASATVKSAYAWSKITSITIAAYAANGSGTGNTFGVGLSNDFGVPSIPGASTAGLNLVCVKATKITKVLGTSNVAADDVAATTTVDTVARTIAPTTAPAANGLVDYEFTYTFGAGA